MAHKYDSFNSAYSQLRSDYDSAYEKFEYMQANRDAVSTAWLAGNDHTAIYFLMWALNNLILLLKYSPNFLYDDPYESSLIESVYWANKDVETPDITMSAILEAMKEAEPHQPLLFIAYLEAYKASVWNATFDERFFADLVKKWAIWG